MIMTDRYKPSPRYSWSVGFIFKVDRKIRMHYKILKKFPSKKCFMNFHSKFKNYQVEWYFGNICNETCSYCLNKYTYEQYYRNMTHDETKKVCDFIKSQIYGLQQLTFIGGEPSCYKDLFFAL